MRKLILILALLLPSIAFGQRTIDFKGLEEQNEIYYYKGTPFTGKSIRKYDNGKKAQLATWKNGQLHGLKTEWRKNGTAREKMNFIAGYRHGEFTMYYDNGSLKQKGNYEKDFLEGTHMGYYRSGNKEFEYNYIKGVKTGLSITYFDFSGKQTYANVDYVEQKVNLVRGIPHGELRSYYRAGNPRKKMNYNMGVLEGAYYSWHINALPAEEAYYKGGKLDSIKRVWDNILGVLISQEFYKNGLKDGKWIVCNQLGDTLIEKIFVNDLLHGPYVEYKDGNKESFGSYVNGKKHGLWKTGQFSSYRKTEGSYKMGMEIGEWLYYDLEGKKLMMRMFDEEGYITKEEIY